MSAAKSTFLLIAFFLSFSTSSVRMVKATSLPAAKARPAAQAGGDTVRYLPIDLGVLDGTSSRAYGINGLGQVVGDFSVPHPDPRIPIRYSHAFLWQDSNNNDQTDTGEMTSLGSLGADEKDDSLAMDVNQSGQVTGGSETDIFYEPMYWETHAFLWQGGSLIDLGVSPCVKYCWATAINDAGQVVGQTYIDESTAHAFLHDGGTTDLGTLGGPISNADDINNLGHVVGWANTADGWQHAFLYKSGTMIDLGVLSGVVSLGTGINEADQVVGWSDWDGGNYRHAFLFKDANDNKKADPGEMIDLGTPPGYENSQALAINSKGQIVGRAFDWGGTYRAMLWEDENSNGQSDPGEMKNLNDLIPSDSGWFLKVAYDINDRGWIVGYGSPNNGEDRAYLLKPQPKPVVFIPGIAGSVLVDSNNSDKELWPGIFTSLGELSLFSSDNPSAGIIATDALRSVFGKNIYDGFLAAFQDAGYVEYDVAGNPNRRTTAGCDDEAQRENEPTLFIFAYDWRKDNSQNAQALWDYFGCIEKFYPDTPVSIVTHSMGSLLARRYILDHPSDHNVNALITIAAPWLGAPKAINVLETGSFIGPESNPLAPGTMKYIAGSFSGAHQLLPDQIYANLAGEPFFGEDGRDFNGNGQSSELYSYEAYLAEMDRVYGFDTQGWQEYLPGTTTALFHRQTSAAGGQDDWSTDSTGIQYFHIYGVQAESRTIERVLMSNQVYCTDSTQLSTCSRRPTTKLEFTFGDGTVPMISALRFAQGINYNAPGAQLQPFFSEDSLVEHNGLVANVEVIQQVLQWLRQVQANEAGMAELSPGVNGLPNLPDPEPAYYLTIGGVDQLSVQDALGNEMTVISGTMGLAGQVPGVDAYLLGERNQMVVLSDASPYTLTWTTTDQPSALELRYGSPMTTTRAVRYVDIWLPMGSSSMLTLDGQNVDVIRYDGDGDGTFESSLEPAVDVSGSAAQDTHAPQIAITTAGPLDDRTIMVTATDDLSGIKTVLYSLDGLNFSLYTAPFSVDTAQHPIVYVFAEDQLANRSPLIQKSLITHELYLPIARK